MSGPLDADLALLAQGRSRRLFGGGSTSEDGGGPGEVLLLVSGAAVLAAETPFGPHPVATLRAPVLLNLGLALGGTHRLFSVVFEGEGEAVAFSAEDAFRILGDKGAAGQAFRRIALASVTAALRDTNASLSRFFDEAGGRPIVPPPSLPAGKLPDSGTERPVDPELVYDLFDAAGLNPSGLPDLGLVARTLSSGASLVLAGTPGEEAYLLAEGRLRVSIRIPGVGEEALAILGPGEIVGEMALIDDAPRSADVFAHEDPATVYVLSRPVFRRLLETGEEAGAPLLFGITIALTRRLEEAIRKSAGFRILAGPF